MLVECVPCLCLEHFHHAAELPNASVSLLVLLAFDDDVRCWCSRAHSLCLYCVRACYLQVWFAFGESAQNAACVSRTLMQQSALFCDASCFLPGISPCQRHHCQPSPKAEAVKTSRCLLRALSLGRAANSCPLPGGVLCPTMMCCARLGGNHDQERCCARQLWLVWRYSHAAFCHGTAEQQLSLCTPCVAFLSSAVLHQLCDAITPADSQAQMHVHVTCLS